MQFPVYSTSPLTDVGLSFISELEKPFTPEQLSQIRDLLTRYLARRISFQECVGILLPVLGTSRPIERLEAILRTPDIPLPPSNRTLSASESRAKSRPWTSYEDQRLLAGIHRYGVDDWQLIAAFVGNGRTKSQCSQRWMRGLDPKICKEQWPSDQDERLIGLVAAFGEKSWTRVAAELGNRCDVQCRYRYKQLQKEPGFEERMAAASERVRQSPGIPNTPKPNARRRKTPDKVLPIRFQSWGSVPAILGMGLQQPIFVPFQSGISTPSFYQQIPMSSAPQAGAKPPVTENPADPPRHEVSQVPSQPSLFTFEPQVSAQGSSVELVNPFSVSPSGSFFGITPVNSFRFEC
jgi:hypothetical protein